MTQATNSPMILTVTPNTALDRIECLPNLTSGKVLRSKSLILSPGGKGVNVARAVQNLGGNAVCTGFLGGFTGRQHAQLVNQEGIPSTWTWIDGETRAAIVIVDEASGETTVINEDGPVVTSVEWDRLQAEVVKQAEKAEAVCLSGSLPLGLAPDSSAGLVKKLNQIHRAVWVDASGPVLRSAIQSLPAVVKVNGLEAAGLLGWGEIQDVATAVQAAITIRQSGISMVILTLGRLGAVLTAESSAWYACPPEIKAICPIGSGDAFLGGLVQAWLTHAACPEALRQAVAAGTANSLSLGGGKFTRQDFEMILTNTTVTQLV